MNDNEEYEPTIILRVRSPDNPLGGMHVAEFFSVAVALMEPPPDVMLWGERVFVFKKRRSNGDAIYVEGLAYPIVEGATATRAEKPIRSDSK